MLIKRFIFRHPLIKLFGGNIITNHLQSTFGTNWNTFTALKTNAFRSINRLDNPLTSQLDGVDRAYLPALAITFPQTR